MSLHIIHGDLFASDGPKAHCVSQDLRMGAGIAKVFRSKYGRVEELQAQDPQVGNIVWLKDLQIFYLVTKPRYFDKPTYKTLNMSLVKLHGMLHQHNIKEIHMPMIGCGLDRLEWPRVKEMLEEVMEGIEVYIHQLP